MKSKYYFTIFLNKEWFSLFEAIRLEKQTKSHKSVVMVTFRFGRFSGSETCHGDRLLPLMIDVLLVSDLFLETVTE